ncbi:MAG: hypothetical protein A3F43_00525 [Gammaproteobacteria bacterium RIFCSPHIGHO2_12_FULL_42_10]|nr:MAG: hypothetical protein A3F43_00525 [Gammaproteobacteria bacterium RIFCSPHIGHO2_12_FULL_42_10]
MSLLIKMRTLVCHPALRAARDDTRAYKTYILIGVLVWLIMASCLGAQDKRVSLDLDQADLVQTIKLMAQLLKVNVMISPMVSGVATLHLVDATPLSAFETLLASQKLAKQVMGNVWLIAPRTELIVEAEQAAKLRDTAEIATPLTTQIWQAQYAKAEEIAKLLHDDRAGLLSKRGSVEVDARTNIIVIHDLPDVVKSASQIIARLDVPVKQVHIAARLVSVECDFERELGLHFVHAGRGAHSMSVATLKEQALLDIRLSALEKRGHARLISSPSLFTADQQTASIEAGEEIPYQEVSEIGGTAAVFKKAVLGLQVTPQTLPHHQVMLHMRINQDRPSNRMIQGVPAISTRQITTHALVKNGETIVLGGIYETDQAEETEQIPFINRIPLFGKILGETQSRYNKRELLIFVTPNVATEQ